MSHTPARDRRAGSPRSGDWTSPRGVLATLRDGLYRPLAGDDDRVDYWMRHVRIGVVVTELAALAVIGYLLLVDEPGRNYPGLLLLTGFSALATPTVLLLPLRAMIRDWRGPTLFYGWTLGTVVAVIAVTRLDGGAASPLASLLLLTLTFAAAAYSPVGVIAMGGAMTAGYLLFVELPGLTTRGLFFVSVMGIFTIVCTMASANSWAAYDRQMLLIRTAEMLASTDALTGIPNRRLFLERVARAVDDAARGRRAVVCLVDLDGFKAVNDAEGHAAGDALLVAVGTALGGAIREADTVARLGGDEFAVLADVAAGRSAPSLAERLREAVALAGARHGVTASVGVAEIDPGDDLETLMHRADVAMYRAKSIGGDRVSVRPV